MSDDDKRGQVHLLELEPDEFAAAMAGLLRNADRMIEYQQYNAKQMRAKYDALLAEGFSEPQALVLCQDIT